MTFVANAQNNEVVSISGTLLMLDEKTLHVTVDVQAVTPAPDGKGEPMLIPQFRPNYVGIYPTLKVT